MIQLGNFPSATFSGGVTPLEAELELMLRKTILPGEVIYLKVQAAPAEAFIVTQSRVIILKGAQRDVAGHGYGRFFGLESIITFSCRGWPRTNFIAVITSYSVNEAIPAFNAWKCSFGTTFVGDLGRSTAEYVKRLEQFIADQRRSMLLQGPMQPIVPNGIAVQFGERFYLEVSAAYYEEKSFRQYAGRSSSISIPVVKGVRMRFGGSRGQSSTESVLQEDDRGTLIIGDRRLVFVGRRRNISTPLTSIATVEAFSNGFKFALPNKKSTQFRTVDDIPGLLLKRLLQVP